MPFKGFKCFLEYRDILVNLLLACENSRPSLLPARVAFRREKNVCDLLTTILY